eukprot:Skav225695  [mRNA]  locus=scaffold1817:108779:113607:+ [translate_table: standard]
MIYGGHGARDLMDQHTGPASQLHGVRLFDVGRHLWPCGMGKNQHSKDQLHLRPTEWAQDGRGFQASATGRITQHKVDPRKRLMVRLASPQSGRPSPSCRSTAVISGPALQAAAAMIPVATKQSGAPWAVKVTVTFA